MLDFGCAVHEEVWTVDGNSFKLRALPSRLPRTFYRWHTEPDGETLTAIEQYGYRGNDFKNVTLPAEKICRFSYEQEGANFWGIALLRSMYPAWFYKDRLQRIDAIGCERNSVGVPVFRLSPGFSKEDWALAFNTVTQLAAHESQGVVEPPGDANSGLRIETPKGQLRPVMPSIVYYNMQMTQSALAMFMSSGQTPHGNRSTTQEHTDFFMLAEQALADDIAWVMTANTIRRMVELNFGVGAPIPHMVAANVQARQLEDIMDVLSKFATSGLILSDEPIRDYIREELGLPAETQEGIYVPQGAVQEGQAKPGEDIASTGQGAAAAPAKGGTRPAGSGTPPPPAAAPGKSNGQAQVAHAGDFAALRDVDVVRSLAAGERFVLREPVHFTSARPASKWMLRLAKTPRPGAEMFEVKGVSDGVISVEAL